MSATFTEPLFLLPFLFHSKYNEAGLLGTNGLKETMKNHKNHLTVLSCCAGVLRRFVSNLSALLDTF